MRRVHKKIVALQKKKQETPHFTQWLSCHKEFLSNKKLLSEEDEHRSTTITKAGILYMMYHFPKDVQKCILKYIIQDIRPCILGLHEEDFGEPRNYYNKPHTNVPTLKHSDAGNYLILKCDRKDPSCTLRLEVRNVHPRFSTYHNNNHIKPIIQIVNAIADKKQWKHSNACIFDARQQHSIISSHGKMVYKWQPKKPTKNQRWLNDIEKTSAPIRLSEALMLLDQNNMYEQPQKLSSSLTFKSKKKLGLLKQLLTETTGAEPIFLFDKIN